MNKQIRDLTGLKFGILTVLKRAGNSEKGSLRWDCVCSCGNIKTVYGNGLKQGNVESCGCLTKIKLDLAGKKFGRLVVISFFDKMGKEKRWKCVCECGSVVIVFGNNLRRGHTMSCGCIEKDRPNATIHGFATHPLFPVWQKIRDRCLNKHSPSYKYYGGRGVKICDEWINSAPNFIKWCLENGWNKGLVVDKDIKSMKLGLMPMLYSPEWCSVVTQKENLQYTRKHKKYANTLRMP